MCRYLHSVKAAEQCYLLSDIYEIPAEKVVQAGILHDAAKGFAGLELAGFWLENVYK